MKSFNLKLNRNKNNGQINISLPKKKLPKKLLDDLKKIKTLKIKLESWK